jgi:hypothetical protein
VLLDRLRPDALSTHAVMWRSMSQSSHCSPRVPFAVSFTAVMCMATCERWPVLWTLGAHSTNHSERVINATANLGTQTLQHHLCVRPVWQLCTGKTDTPVKSVFNFLKHISLKQVASSVVLVCAMMAPQRHRWFVGDVWEINFL